MAEYVFTRFSDNSKRVLNQTSVRARMAPKESCKDTNCSRVITLNDSQIFQLFSGYRITVFLFVRAYSNVFAAPPQP